MQRFVDGIFLLLFRYFVESEFSLLGGGERARLLRCAFARLVFALVEGLAARCAGGWCWGGRADWEGALADALVVVRGGSVRGEGALKERLGEGDALGVGHGGGFVWMLEFAAELLDK